MFQWHSRTEGSSAVRAAQGRGPELHTELPPLWCLTPVSLCFPKPNRSVHYRFSFTGTVSSSHQMYQRECFRKHSYFHFLDFLSCVFSASSRKPSSFQDDPRLLSFLEHISWSSSWCRCPAVLEAAPCWGPMGRDHKKAATNPGWLQPNATYKQQIHCWEHRCSSECVGVVLQAQAQTVNLHQDDPAAQTQEKEHRTLFGGTEVLTQSLCPISVTLQHSRIETVSKAKPTPVVWKEELEIYSGCGKKGNKNCTTFWSSTSPMTTLLTLPCCGFPPVAPAASCSSPTGLCRANRNWTITKSLLAAPSLTQLRGFLLPTLRIQNVVIQLCRLGYSLRRNQMASKLQSNTSVLGALLRQRVLGFFAPIIQQLLLYLLKKSPFKGQEFNISAFLTPSLQIFFSSFLQYIYMNIETLWVNKETSNEVITEYIHLQNPENK